MPESAQWCSLCFADLRLPAEPEPAPDIAPEAVTPEIPLPVASYAGAGGGVLAGTALDPRTPVPGHTPPAAPVPAENAGTTLVASPELAPAAPATPPEPHHGKHALPPLSAEASWPCPRCGVAVALSVDACPECGAGFLAGASTKVPTKFPVVGDVMSMTPGQRWLIAMGISAALVVVLVVMLFIVGKVL